MSENPAFHDADNTVDCHPFQSAFPGYSALLLRARTIRATTYAKSRVNADSFRRRFGSR